MCEFCKKKNGNEPLMFDFENKNKIDKLSIIKEGKMFSLRYKSKHEKIDEIVEIKFCPMCGRKLKEE